VGNILYNSRQAYNLKVELCADEHGKAVPEDCRVKHVASSRTNLPATLMALKFKTSPLPSIPTGK
jgi:hypothetical protein